MNCLEFLSTIIVGASKPERAIWRWKYQLHIPVPFIGVRFLVLDESIAMCEGLFTDIALKPLPNMVFAVSPKLFLGGELCITSRTWQTGGLLAVSLVFEMTPRFSEFPPTLGAVQGSSAFLMDKHVVCQSV